MTLFIFSIFMVDSYFPFVIYCYLLLSILYENVHDIIYLYF